MDIIHDPSTGPFSPQKGKGTEADVKTWRAGWWDFYPLLEHPKRPLQWTQSSVIFAAHATQPMITGRHFSSSKQFVLPTPPPITSSPTSYDPPSIISVSPDDVWLLAYFYRRDGEGIACLWKRGHQIDNWQVKDYWTYSKGCGIVAISWLENHRDWITANNGVPTRLPLRGPKIPVAEMTMLLVTQDNCFHVTYLRQYTNGLKTVKKSLAFSQGVAREGVPNPDHGENPSHIRQCLDAAIGLGYNDNTIVVASHSRRLPPPPPASLQAAPPFNSMDLSTGEDSTDATDPSTNDWESWGEERVIEVYECQIRFDGNSIMLFVNQLNNVECPALSLTSMVWACFPPPKQSPTEKGKLGLIATFVNFHDYTKSPTSTINFYGLYQKVISPTNRLSLINLSSSRIIVEGVVTYIEPFLDKMVPMAYACILNMSGSYSTGKSKSQEEATIGSVHVLNIPQFSDNKSWIPATIKASLDKLGGDLPLFATISPNRKLLCTHSSSLTQSHILIHALPSLDPAEQSNPRLSLALANAILTHRSTVDLIYSICSPPMSINDVADVLYHTHTVLDKFNSNDMPFRFTCDIMGIATEIYKSKAASTKVDTEIELFKGRWQAAHDMCSMAACTTGFEDCKEGAIYDLEAVWQLIALCTWVIEFTERLMKACILASNATVDAKEGSDSQLLAQPSLLHLCHPFALQNFLAALNHVKAFRTFLATMPAGSENAQIAQSVLIDTVDCSGVDFGSLISLLQDNMEPVRQLEPPECRKALATCRPTSLMQTHLVQLLDKISQSETLLNKSALFIKPYDLIDGMARLSVVSHRKNDERDVITKSSLPKHGPKDLCLRCGGKTVIDRNTTTPGPRRVHSKWHVYELMWQLRCICGGPWASLPGAI